MNDFISQHPEVVIQLLKIAFGIITFMFTSILSLVVYIVTRFEASLSHLKSTVATLVSSHTRLSAEHNLRKEYCGGYYSGELRRYSDKEILNQEDILND